MIYFDRVRDGRAAAGGKAMTFPVGSERFQEERGRARRGVPDTPPPAAFKVERAIRFSPGGPWASG